MYKLERLQEVFEPDEIEWRIGQSGTKKEGEIWAKALAYVSNRAIQNRLDEVFGALNWQNEFKEWHKDSQICGISVFNDSNKQWVTKWDGADNTNFESTKGGLSDSMKRAGYQWGIGRYLYRLPEKFVETSTSRKQDWNYAQTKDKKAFYWRTPDLPNWALPKDLQQDTEIVTENDKISGYIQMIGKKVSHDKIDTLLDKIYKLEQPYQNDRLSQLKGQLSDIGSSYVMENRK